MASEDVIDKWNEAAESWDIGRGADGDYPYSVLATFQGDALRDAGNALAEELRQTRAAIGRVRRLAKKWAGTTYSSDDWTDALGMASDELREALEW